MKHLLYVFLFSISISATLYIDYPLNMKYYDNMPWDYSYNKDTIKILTDLGIELGFKQIITIEPEKGMKSINNSFLEIARQDHAGIIKKMNK